MTVFGFPYMTLLPAIVSKSLGFAVQTDAYNRAVADRHGGQRDGRDDRAR